MGVVYLAERADLGSLVAIKILRDAWLSPARRERFATEQRTLAQLNHPSIARLYDADTLPDGTPWFVMEYVEGEPITEYCARTRALLRIVCGCFAPFARPCNTRTGMPSSIAILKPSNILVKSDGGVGLLDFGIAKQLDEVGQPMDQTRTELRLMTPAYAAPEQLRGERVGVFTDVYALGVILYELLAGCAPFDLSSKRRRKPSASSSRNSPSEPSLAAKRTSSTSKASLGRSRRPLSHRHAQGHGEALQIDGSADPGYRPLSCRRTARSAARHVRAIGLASLCGETAGLSRATLLAAATLTAMVVFFTVRLARPRNTAVVGGGPDAARAAVHAQSVFRRRQIGRPGRRVAARLR